MGIHGMSLTWLIAMDGTVPLEGNLVKRFDVGRHYKANMSCRSVIELMHWVKPDSFWYYRETSFVNNLTFFRVLPVSVVFGNSVHNPDREKKMLMRNTFWYKLKGFNDQFPLYNLDELRDILLKAFHLVQRCD